MNNILRLITFVICSFGLVACSSYGENGWIKEVDAGKKLEIKDPIKFKAIMGSEENGVRYHGLMPGIYKAEAEDDLGVFYRGEGLAVFLDRDFKATDDVYTREAGGFWLAKNKRLSVGFRLYRLNGGGAAGGSSSAVHESVARAIIYSGQNFSIAQAGLAGAVGGALVSAIVGANGSTSGNWVGQFVPIQYDQNQVEQIFLMLE